MADESPSYQPLIEQTTPNDVETVGRHVEAAALPQSPRSPLSPQPAPAAAGGKTPLHSSPSQGPSQGLKAAVAAVPQRCGSCGKAESASLVLRRCSACKCIAYCSTPCQHADWQARHAGECATLQQLAGLLAGKSGVADVLKAAMAQPRSGLGRAVQALLAAKLASIEEAAQQQQLEQQKQEHQRLEQELKEAAAKAEGMPEGQGGAEEAEQVQAAALPGAHAGPASAGERAEDGAVKEDNGQAAVKQLVEAAFSAVLARQAPEAPQRDASAEEEQEDEEQEDEEQGRAKAVSSMVKAAIEAALGGEQLRWEAA